MSRRHAGPRRPTTTPWMQSARGFCLSACERRWWITRSRGCGRRKSSRLKICSPHRGSNPSPVEEPAPQKSLTLPCPIAARDILWKGGFLGLCFPAFASRSKVAEALEGLAAKNEEAESSAPQPHGSGMPPPERSPRVARAAPTAAAGAEAEVTRVAAWAATERAVARVGAREAVRTEQQRRPSSAWCKPSPWGRGGVRVQELMSPTLAQRAAPTSLPASPYRASTPANLPRRPPPPRPASSPALRSPPALVAKPRPERGGDPKNCAAVRRAAHGAPGRAPPPAPAPRHRAAPPARLLASPAAAPREAEEVSDAPMGLEPVLDAGDGKDGGVRLLRVRVDRPRSR